MHPHSAQFQIYNVTFEGYCIRIKPITIIALQVQANVIFVCSSLFLQ